MSEDFTPSGETLLPADVHKKYGLPSDDVIKPVGECVLAIVMESMHEFLASKREAISDEFLRRHYLHTEKDLRERARSYASLITEEIFIDAIGLQGVYISFEIIKQNIQSAMNIWLQQEGDDDHSIGTLLTNILKVGREKRPKASELEGKLRLKIARILRISSETRHLMNNMIGDIRANPYQKAPDRSAREVRDVGSARDLWMRHKLLLRSPDIVAAAKAGPAAIEVIRQKIAKLGGFLQDYPLDLIKGRILDPLHWIIFEAKGKKINRASYPPFLEKERYAADIQIHIPDDKPDAALYFDLPDTGKGDTYFDGEDIADTIRAEPAIAGCVADFCAEDDVAHQGFASKARDEGIRYIREVINSRRRQRIRFLIAEIFTATGVRLQDGEIVQFPTPITNTASKAAHLFSEKHGTILGWRRVNDEVPVMCEDDDPAKPPAVILTDWDVMIHTI